MPYSTLLYGNGPGYSVPRAIPANVTAGSAPGSTAAVEEDEEARNRVHGAAVPRQWATHGGEDVPVYSQVSGGRRHEVQWLTRTASARGIV